MKRSAKASMLLILAALIWGSAFTAQSAGMDYIEPFTFNGIRFIIGGLVLLPLVFIRDRITIKRNPADYTPEAKAARAVLRRKTINNGIICGLFLCVATSVQQFGILYTSAGKAGFITALYVIMIPITGLVLFGKKGTPLLWVSAVLAIVGMYFLCLSGSSEINKGDVLVFICAILFTGHMTAIDKLAPDVDGIKLSCIQFFTAGIICCILMPIFETPKLENILACTLPILYTGVLSCGVAYTLQVVGQQKTDPTIASILLSLESVFSVLTAWLVLGDSLTGREILGCVIVFTAIVLAQLPTPSLKRKAPSE